MKFDKNLYSALKFFSWKTRNGIGSGCSTGLVSEASFPQGKCRSCHLIYEAYKELCMIVGES